MNTHQEALFFKIKFVSVVATRIIHSCSTRYSLSNDTCYKRCGPRIRPPQSTSERQSSSGHTCFIFARHRSSWWYLTPHAKSLCLGHPEIELSPENILQKHRGCGLDKTDIRFVVARCILHYDYSTCHPLYMPLMDNAPASVVILLCSCLVTIASISSTPRTRLSLLGVVCLQPPLR